MRTRPLTLRTTLLAGYGLGMCLVLGGFGLVAQSLYWRTLMRDLDADLSARARAVARSITEDGGAFEILIPSEVRTFLVEQPDAYYVIRSDGRTIDFTRPDLEIPPLSPPASRSRDGRREVAVAGEGSTTVIMGRVVTAEQTLYREFVQTLLIAGVAGMTLALLTGWLLVRRTLMPVARIGRTADAMSAENLGLRIDVAGTESELGDVARALNGAFDRLQAAFERQTRFTADASHELRTPLTTVLSETEWALRRERSSEEYRRAFGACLRAAGRMRDVVEGLLALARADAGQARFMREPLDLADAVREVAAGLAPTAAAHGITLETSLAPAVTTGDRERMRELLGNLIGNAIDYNREGGRVHVSTRDEAGFVTVDVEDSGIGIAAADLPHIFERFYRADAARTRAVGGSGLGLAIVRWIATEHGGTVECSSIPGEGSRFVVRLPKIDV